jgi:C4-dicarboxylate transporter
MEMPIVDFEENCYYSLLELLPLCCVVVTVCAEPSALTLNKIDDIRAVLHSLRVRLNIVAMETQ